MGSTHVAGFLPRLALCLGVLVASPSTALAEHSPLASVPATTPSSGPAAGELRYNLRQLVDMARASYPGVEAAREAVVAMERDVYRAKWAWLPQGNVRGLLAPAPGIHCAPDRHDCRQTDAFSVNSFSIQGVLARIELEVGMPLYTFDKLGAAKRAAAAGVEIRKAQVRVSEDKLVLDVTKAYWGLKLAREILYTLKDGRSYVVDAEKKIEKDLEDGEGDFTVTDLLRLKTARAEVDARLPEAEKLERLTLAALATLTGMREKPFDVDTQILEVLAGKPLAIREYLEMARRHRPEVGLLSAAVRARAAAADLEWARFFPDFLLVAMVGYASTSSVDDPQNAFYSDPFNFFTAGFGLALSWKLDQVQQYGQYQKARAEARATKAQEAEAVAGIDLEIKRAWADLVEAQGRMDAASKGEKAARQWLVAVSQNLAAGLAETRDLTDALVGYFQLRLRNLQAMYDVNVGWSELARTIGTNAKRQ